VPPTAPVPQEVLPSPAEVAVAELPLPTETGEEDLAGGLRMPDFSGMSYRQVLQVMEKNGINLKLNGTGRVIEQFPQAGRTIQYGTEVWVRFATPS
jgi:cell division protein FtsI (penicillin-binding protein 3)